MSNSGRRGRQARALDFEALENRLALSSMAVIEWQIAPQITLDINHGSEPDLPNTSAYVNPPDGYEVLLSASNSTGIDNQSVFMWTITNSAGMKTTLQGLTPNIDLQQGAYSVELEAVNLEGTTGPSFATTTVNVKDILIVAIGDSYASGEGNPVVNGYYGIESPEWAYSPDSTMETENANAHRSTIAAPAQFAYELQEANPQEAVTFVSVANSGATIYNGLLNPMTSIGNPNATLPAEIGEVQKIVGSHPINVLTVSVGADDIGFTNLVSELHGYTFYGSPTLKSINAQVSGAISQLPTAYGKLATAIASLDAGTVMITQYPDLTRNQNGEYAPIEIYGVDYIDRAAVEFASKHIIAPLDQAISAAAQAHGWTYINGLSADFRTHGYSSTDSWIRDVNDSEEYQDSDEGAFHPNAAGHLDIAAHLLAAYEQGLGTATATGSKPKPKPKRTEKSCHHAVTTTAQVQSRLRRHDRVVSGTVST
jgi:hypothetical protein